MFLSIADSDVYLMKSKNRKHILVYDGACDFCIFCINRWKHLTKDRVVYAPYQAVSHQFSDIPISDFQTSVQFILDDGRVYSGAEAIFRALDNRRLIWFYEKLPGFSKITEMVYRMVAENRSFFSSITRLFFRTHSN